MKWNKQNPSMEALIRYFLFDKVPYCWSSSFMNMLSQKYYWLMEVVAT